MCCYLFFFFYDTATTCIYPYVHTLSLHDALPISAGLVHFISVKPTNSPSGYANIQYGSDNEVIAEGAVSGPITNGFRARLAGKMARHDGHYRNRYLGA